MEQKKRLPVRGEICGQDKWNIEDLFATEEEWEREYHQTECGL